MKSVCILTYNPFKYGGVERVISILANNLVDEYDVSILCVDKSVPVNRSIYNLNKNVHILFTKVDQYYHRYFHIFEKILKTIHQNTHLMDNAESLLTYAYFNRHKKLISNIKEIIVENNFDYIIGANAFFSIILGMIKPNCQAKMIGWQHSSYAAYFEKKGHYCYKQEIIANKYFKYLDYYIVLINYEKNIVKEKLGIEATVIPNPKSFSSNEKSKLSNKIFITTGRLVEAKGFDLLIDSFNLFCKYDRKWKLMIVGDGNKKKELIKRITEYHLSDRIILCPFTNNIRPFLINASIYLCSSRWEGFGLSVLEALECGLPVISYSIPAMQEILKDSSELLVEKNNVESYSKRMLFLANCSKKQLRDIVNKNNENLTRYEVNNILKEWEKILK